MCRFYKLSDSLDEEDTEFEETLLHIGIRSICKWRWAGRGGCQCLSLHGTITDDSAKSSQMIMSLGDFFMSCLE